MKKKAAPKKAASKTAAARSSTVKTKPKETELIAIELLMPLVKGMEVVGIQDREEYINFLISSSLLNYSKIWKEETALEKEIQQVKQDSDHENYLR